MSGIIYFLYNEKMPNNINEFKNKKINGIVYIPTEIIRHGINSNWINIKSRYKINDKDKNNLNESYGSSFLPLSLKYLVSKYKIPISKNKKEFLEVVAPYIKSKNSKNKKLRLS